MARSVNCPRSRLCPRSTPDSASEKGQDGGDRTGCHPGRLTSGRSSGMSSRRSGSASGSSSVAAAGLCRNVLIAICFFAISSAGPAVAQSVPPVSADDADTTCSTSVCSSCERGCLRPPRRRGRLRRMCIPPSCPDGVKMSRLADLRQVDVRQASVQCKIDTPVYLQRPKGVPAGKHADDVSGGKSNSEESASSPMATVGVECEGGRR